MSLYSDKIQCIGKSFEHPGRKDDAPSKLRNYAKEKQIKNRRKNSVYVNVSLCARLDWGNYEQMLSQDFIVAKTVAEASFENKQEVEDAHTLTLEAYLINI